MQSSRIDRSLHSAISEALVPGLVAEVRGRRGVLFSGAYGAASLEPYSSMQPESVFRIASMTKLVTSIAILMLVDDGMVDLDQPLVRYMPNFLQPEVLTALDEATLEYSTKPAFRSATLRELLSHTGGYGYWFLNDSLLRTSGPNPNLTDPPFLISEPGEKFAYSSSHDVAGQLIEAVSGSTLESFFEERIFGPLKMGDTSFSPPDNRARLVSVAWRSNNGLEQIPNETTGQAPRGGGGLYSTAGDYLALLQCVTRGGDPLLNRRTASELTRNQIGALMAAPAQTALPERTNDFLFMDGTQKFGLGVMVETRNSPLGRSEGSFAWAGIFNTYFWVDSKADIMAVLLMQLKPFADPHCVDILRAFEMAVYDVGTF